MIITKSTKHEIKYATAIKTKYQSLWKPPSNCHSSMRSCYPHKRQIVYSSNARQKTGAIGNIRPRWDPTPNMDDTDCLADGYIESAAS